MTDPNEQIAVGTTEDGTVVFYDPAMQPRIRQVLPKQPPTGGGKSVPPIVLIDELAELYLGHPRTGKTIQADLTTALRGMGLEGVEAARQVRADAQDIAARFQTRAVEPTSSRHPFTRNGFGDWCCNTCGTEVAEPARDPETGRDYCQICALGKECES